MRFGSVSEASFRVAHTRLASWRDAAAACGHPVVGDRPHCDGPTACMWLLAVRVEARHAPDAGGAGGAGGEAGRRLAASGSEAPAPERFAKLLARERATCARVDAGEVTSEYVQRILRERAAAAEGGAAIGGAA